MVDTFEIGTRIYGFDSNLKQSDSLLEIVDSMVSSIFLPYLCGVCAVRKPTGEIVLVVTNFVIDYSMKEIVSVFMSKLKRKRAFRTSKMYLLRDIICNVEKEKLVEKYGAKKVEDALGIPNDPFVTAYIESEEKELKRLGDERSKLISEREDALDAGAPLYAEETEKKIRQLTYVISNLTKEIHEAKVTHQAKLSK